MQFGRDGAKKARALAKNKALWDRMKKVGIVAAEDATYDTALAIIKLSRELVPVKTGFLRSTAFVAKPRVVGKAVKVDLGYTARYALAVHETNKRAPRYLDRAIEEVAPEWPFRVAQGANRRMAKVKATTIRM